MAFPSLGGTRQNDCAETWVRARILARRVKDTAQSVRDLSAAGTLAASSVLSFATLLADMKVEFNNAAAVQGIGAYAQSQINDPSFNVATSFSGMLSAMDSVTAWIIANFPKDGSGFLLGATFNADNSGRQIDRTFSAA